MMKKNELRIGNLFQCKIRANEGEVILPVLELCEWGILHSKHKEIGDMDSPRYGLSNVHEVRAEVPYSAANGIPLTSDILEKCDIYTKFAEEFTLAYKDGCIVIEEYHEGAFPLKHIKFVHQLQNLIFALTGEELNVQL